jgi:hypothetical protein
MLRKTGLRDALGECICELATLDLSAETTRTRLQEAQKIADDLEVGPTSDLARALERLRQALHETPDTGRA